MYVMSDYGIWKELLGSVHFHLYDSHIIPYVQYKIPFLHNILTKLMYGTCRSATQMGLKKISNLPDHKTWPTAWMATVESWIYENAKHKILNVNVWATKIYMHVHMLANVSMTRWIPWETNTFLLSVVCPKHKHMTQPYMKDPCTIGKCLRFLSAWIRQHFPAS